MQSIRGSSSGLLCLALHGFIQQFEASWRCCLLSKFESPTKWDDTAMIFLKHICDEPTYPRGRFKEIKQEWEDSVVLGPEVAESGIRV